MSKLKYNHTFTIDRARWANGLTRDVARDSNSLYNGDRTMCCLGFACRSYGLLVNDIKGCSFPTKVAPHTLVDTLPEYLTYMTNWLQAVVQENDSSNGSLKDKEYLIKELFEEQGVKVEFIGKYNLKDLK